MQHRGALFLHVGYSRCTSRVGAVGIGSGAQGILAQGRVILHVGQGRALVEWWYGLYFEVGHRRANAGVQAHGISGVPWTDANCQCISVLGTRRIDGLPPVPLASELWTTTAPTPEIPTRTHRCVPLKYSGQPALRRPLQRGRGPHPAA